MRAGRLDGPLLLPTDAECKPVPPVLDLLESVLHRAGSPPSSSVVHSEPPSGTPSRRLPRGRRLCLKLDQLLKTAVGGGAGSLGGVTGKLNASGPPALLSFGVAGSRSLQPQGRHAANTH